MDTGSQIYLLLGFGLVFALGVYIVYQNIKANKNEAPETPSPKKTKNKKKKRK